MRMIDLIDTKKRGGSLTAEQLHWWITSVAAGTVPDYQTASLLMAIFLRGLDADETMRLTVEMMNSGETIDLASIEGTTADKHSTGGVGDKLSFLVGPLAAACGVPVPMLSGRALGHTGGTLDKLESIPGYRTRLDTGRFIEIVRETGLSIIGQTDELAPADRKLYALRDATATVESIPLIVGSILSKKFAAGPEVLVFDVKCGDGAFLADLDSCRTLGKTLVDVSCRMGRRATAILTDMNAPLGHKVGNALEIDESIDVLRGGDGSDMMEPTFVLAAEMVFLAGAAEDREEARRKVEDALASGRALEVFRKMIEAHGGESNVLDDRSLLPRSRFRRVVKARSGGFVQAIGARAIGLASTRLGAGRERAEDAVSPGAGIEILRKRGDEVAAADPIAVMHADEEERLDAAENDVAAAWRIGPEKPSPTPPVIETIRSDRDEGGNG